MPRDENGAHYQDVPAHVVVSAPGRREPEMLVPGLKELMADYERLLIRRALAAAGGNQRRAARALGVLPTTLSEKMKRLGIRGRLGRDLPD
jgi:DNA-binding NtrC family response regulator